MACRLLTVKKPFKTHNKATKNKCFSQRKNTYYWVNVLNDPSEFSSIDILIYLHEDNQGELIETSVLLLPYTASVQI